MGMIYLLLMVVVLIFDLWIECLFIGMEFVSMVKVIRMVLMEWLSVLFYLDLWRYMIFMLFNMVFCGIIVIILINMVMVL